MWALTDEGMKKLIILNYEEGSLHENELPHPR